MTGPGPLPGGGYPLLIEGFEEHDVDGGTIEGQAQTITSKAGDVENFNADLSASHNRATEGVAGTLTSILSGADQPTKNAGRQLVQRITSGGGSVRQFGFAVTEFDGTVQGLNRQIQQGKDAEEQREIKGRLNGQHSTAVSTLEQAATKAARQLRHPLDTETITSLYRAGALPSQTPAIFGITPTELPVPTRLPTDIEAMSHAERAQYVLDNEDIDQNLLGLILQSTAVTNIIGRHISEEARGLDEDSSNEDFGRVADLLERFKDNENIGVAFLRDTPAASLITMISLGAMQSLNGKDDGPRFSTGLRDMFRKGEGGLDEKEQRDYAQGLVDHFRDSFIDHEDTGYTGNDPLALSFLMRDSDLSTPFLDRMGDQLDRLERDFDGNFSWRQATTGALGGGGLFEEGDQEGAFDPFASYMSALGRNDEASLQFFTGGGEAPLSGDAVDDRQQYYIEQRKWGHDDFNGLLSALDSATTGTHGQATEDGRQDASALAARTVEMLANRVEGKSSDGTELNFDDGDKFAPGDLGGEGSRHLAHIFGNYMAAVDHYNMNPGGSDPTATFTRIDGTVMKDMPVFDMDDVSTVLKTGMANEDGFAAMRTAVSTYQDVNIGSLIQHEYGQPGFQDKFDDTTNSDARLEALFLDAVGEQEIADGKDKDEQREAWVDLGEDAAGLIPFDKIPVAGPVVGFAADQAIGAGADAIKEDLMHYESDARNDANSMAQTALTTRTNSITEALYDHGALPPDMVRERAERLEPGMYDRYFAGNDFPTREEIAGDTTLQNLISELANDSIDTNSYRLNYENEFHKYFE